MILTKRNNGVVPAKPYEEPQPYARGRNISLSQYKKNKIKMLERDFCIILTEEEVAKLNSMTSEMLVDRCARGIMDKHWD